MNAQELIDALSIAPNAQVCIYSEFRDSVMPSGSVVYAIRQEGIELENVYFSIPSNELGKTNINPEDITHILIKWF